MEEEATSLFAAGAGVAVVVTPARIYGEGFERILAEAGVAVAAVVAPGSGVCPRVRQVKPNLVLLDAGLQENLLAARLLAREFPTIRLIAVSESRESHVAAYVEAGVVGWIPSEACAAELVSVVEDVCRDGASCSQRAAALLMGRLRLLAHAQASHALGGMTARELELLGLIEAGLSNAEIAAQLCIARATVKNHVHNILRKLGVESRVEAAALWRTLAT